MTLPDGNYVFTAQATDIAGNVSHPRAVQRDDRNGRLADHRRGQPDHPAPRASARTSSHSRVDRDGPAEYQVQVYLGGNLLGTAKANGQGTWSFTYAPSSSTVPAGIYGFSAVALDSWGTSAPRRRRFSSRSAEARPRARRSLHRAALGPGDPGQPGLDRRRQRRPRRRGGRLLGQLAVHAHTGEGQTQHHGGGYQQLGQYKPLVGSAEHQCLKISPGTEAPAGKTMTRRRGRCRSRPLTRPAAPSKRMSKNIDRSRTAASKACAAAAAVARRRSPARLSIESLEVRWLPNASMPRDGRYPPNETIDQA